MNVNKYLLTFDFRILFCQDINLISACKELNIDTLEFSYFNEDLDILNYSYEIDTSYLEFLVKNVLTGEIGTELSEKEMKWVQLFEENIEKDNSILDDDKLSFNYLILKLKLLGFEENIAKKIITTYYSCKYDNKNVPSVSRFIKNINRMLKNKYFWICNDLEDEKEFEYLFLDTIFSFKNTNNELFNFNKFKEDYLKICEKSFINKIYKFNKTHSYLVTNPIDISEQKQFLLYIYNKQLQALINLLISTKYYNLEKETMFLNRLIEEMTQTLNIYISLKERSL